MEISILEDRANPLLHRHEVRFEVAHATRATPNREEVRGELSKLVHAPKDRVIVERMEARFGTATTRGEALVYESVEAAKSTEREHILVRNKLKEKVAKGPAAPPAEPAPPAPKAEEPPKAPAPTAEAPAPEASKPEPPKAEPHKAEAHKGKAAKHEAESKEEGKSPPSPPSKKE